MSIRFFDGQKTDAMVPRFFAFLTSSTPAQAPLTSTTSITKRGDVDADEGEGFVAVADMAHRKEATSPFQSSFFLFFSSPAKARSEKTRCHFFVFSNRAKVKKESSDFNSKGDAF